MLEQLAYEPDLRELFDICPELTVEDLKLAWRTRRRQSPVGGANQLATLKTALPQMRFILDQSADRRLAPHRKDLVHAVAVVAADYPAALPDEQVLAVTHQGQRIMITEDRDFGELVFGAVRRTSASFSSDCPPSN